MAVFSLGWYHFVPFTGTSLDQGQNCGNCSRDHATVGIKDYSITLNADNDIHLKGKCTLCNGDVGCYLEYGEVPLLFQRAEDLRKAYRNQGNMKVVKNE